jgi:hypothetical protein
MSRNRFERFYGSSGLDSEVASRLDRNFTQLEQSNKQQQIVESFTIPNTSNLETILADATSAGLSVFLPSSPAQAFKFTIIKVDSSGNTITVDGGTNNISGSATFVLSNQYDYITIIGTDVEWLIIAQTP